MSFASVRGRMTLPGCVLLVFLCAVFGLVGIQNDARAQELPSLVVAKTDGVGKEGEPPVPGVTFQLTSLPDITANDDDELSTLARSNPRLLTEAPGTSRGAVYTATTGNDGLAVFLGIQPGVYQLVELPSFVGEDRPSTTSPALVLVRSGERKLVRGKTQPLFVNKESQVAAARPGQRVTYRVESNVPDVDVHGKLYRYEFSDQLDDAFASGEVDAVTVRSLGKAMTLEPGRHYVDSSSGRVLSFELTDAGLDTVAQARAGHPETRMEVQLHGILRSDLDDGARVLNRAVVAFDGKTAHDRVLSPLVTVVIDSASTTEPVPPREEDDFNTTSTAGKKPGEESSQSDRDQADNNVDGAEPGEQRSTPREILASTGASILGLVLAGLCLILAGIIFLRRRRADEDSRKDFLQSSSNSSEQ